MPVTVNHSRLLRAKIAMVSARLHGAAEALWNHPRFADVYPTYLFHNHAVVRASVPLMRAALARAQADFQDDALGTALATYLAQHIPEEVDHDDWLLEDLEVLGVDRDSVRAWLPPPTVATLVGAQYYWIAHFHPVAILGYIAVLEGTPPVEDDLQAVAQRAGLPLRAFSTLVRHARLDPHHRDDLDEALDQLPLTAAHAALLGVSAFHTVHGLSRVVEDAIGPPKP